MELGLFAMPAHPPERDLRTGFEFDLEVLRWCDAFGFKEAWIGEHHGVAWEPLPAPDILIAQAFRETKTIRLGPGGFILPFHHPIQIADRLSLLDHISGGRLNFGIATGGLPCDWAMFNIDGTTGVLREMAKESVEIILRLWTEKEPWTHEGRFWKVTKPEKMFDLFWHHLKPLQKPHPPIAMAGTSAKSDTLKTCGEKGYWPMSLAFNNSYLAGHWETIKTSAESAGRKANRKDWRIARQIFVADTDAEAKKLAINGGMGHFEVEYNLKLLKAFGILDSLKGNPNMADSDLTADYMANNNWIVGSPETVTRKIREMHEVTGGFGTLMALGYDYVDNPGAWKHSLELLGKEVYPRIKHL